MSYYEHICGIMAVGFRAKWQLLQMTKALWQMVLICMFLSPESSSHGLIVHVRLVLVFAPQL